MNPVIDILHQHQGAARARGIAVIIDVLRASSTVCYLAAAGAGRIWTVADEASARALSRTRGNAVLIGERHGRRVPGFDWGNSPSLLKGAALTGRDVIFTTSNGTRGLAAVQCAEEILTGSFVNANAVVAYLRSRRNKRVSLVCMGSGGRPALEDTLCAIYLHAALKNRPFAFAPLRAAILRGAGAAPFKQADCADMPPEDLSLCLALDRFDFVLKAIKDSAGVIALERVPRPAD
jgi:2-phosphosulfolactate phosphatase